MAHGLVVVELDALLVGRGGVDEGIDDHHQLIQGLLREEAVGDAEVEGQVDAPRRVLVDVPGLPLGAYGDGGHQKHPGPLADELELVARPLLPQRPLQGPAHGPVFCSQEEVNVGHLEERRAGEALSRPQGEAANPARRLRGGEDLRLHHPVPQIVLDLSALDLAQHLQLEAQLLPILPAEGPAGHDGMAGVPHLQAHHPQALFDRLGGAVAHDDAHQLLDLGLPFLGGGQVTLLNGGVDLLPDVGDEVGAGQDGPVGPGGQGGGHDLVVAHEDAYPALDLLEERLQEGHVARGVLDAHHVVEVGHPLCRPPLEVGAGALGDVVHDDGKPHLVHPLEVLVDLVEGGLEVEGGHHQGCCGPGLLGPAGELHRLAGGGAARPGHHRHAPGHLVQGDLDGPLPLLEGEIDELARRAAGHHPVHVGQHVADECPVGPLIYLAVLGEGGNQGGENAFEPVGFLGH